MKAAQIWVHWWLLIIIVGLNVMDWIADRYNAGVLALGRALAARRQHQLELKKAELQIIQAQAVPEKAPRFSLRRRRSAR